jgi:hypothetical protein
MEPNEWQVLIGGIVVTDPMHDYGSVMRLARGSIALGKGHVVVEARAVTPWRDVEIPYPPDNEEVQT